MVKPTRTCTHCGRTYPETACHFHRAAKGKGGLRPDCKECHRRVSQRYNRRVRAQRRRPTVLYFPRRDRASTSATETRATSHTWNWRASA